MMKNVLHNPEDITVVIPAAGRVPEGLVALSNLSCTAMVPVAGRPVIYWTLKYLQSLGLKKFIIAVPQRGLFIEEFVAYTAGPDCECTFIIPPDTSDNGLIKTIDCLLGAVKTPSALVVLGDTYFQFGDADVLNHSELLVLTGPVEESYRWCVVETDEDSTVCKLSDKQRGLTGTLQALIGVYYFPNIKQVQEIIASSLEKKGGTTIGSVLSQLSTLSLVKAQRAGEWLDCGNPDRQAASHVALLQKRGFNELSIDRRLSTITKRSQLKEKFLDEIRYLKLLPPEVAVLFPRIVSASTDAESPYVTLEFYGYGTLADMFVYENLDPGIWERIFQHLFDILTEVFANHPQSIPKEHMLDMYLEKTKRRIEELASQPDLQSLVRTKEVVIINGKPVQSLHMLWPQIEKDVQLLAESTSGAIIHGDMCFSNVLYDVRSQIPKFVDPRGSFGSKGIYGDPRYDVAKQYHSVFGLYDFICNDLFSISQEGNEITLVIYTPVQQKEILARFEKAFFPHFNKHEIVLITGLLFASLAALHYDKPKRQLAFYTRALQIFSEIYPVLDNGSHLPEHETNKL